MWSLKKIGKIFEPTKDLWWCKSHAMVPTPYLLPDQKCRVYFSGRDENNVSHIGWVLVDLANPSKVIEVSNDPVLSPGRLGCFDDNGVTPSCAIDVNGRMHLYYIGWNPGSTVRMHLFGGLAISDDQGKTFTRYSEAPILERCKSDPFLNTAPFVVPLDHGYRIFYVSGTEWLHKDLPRYLIKTAWSKDGLNWERDGRVCIGYDDDSVNALARPFVFRRSERYYMFYASKGQNYKLRLATSLDGLNWEHIDEQLKFFGGEGDSWDSDMMEYASVVQHNRGLHIYYNGNDYGRHGFGLASLQE